MKGIALSALFLLVPVSPARASSPGDAMGSLFSSASMMFLGVLIVFYLLIKWARDYARWKKADPALREAMAKQRKASTKSSLFLFGLLALAWAVIEVYFWLALRN